jgi:serine/threonine protein kinase
MPKRKTGDSIRAPMSPTRAAPTRAGRRKRTTFAAELAPDAVRTEPSPTGNEVDESAPTQGFPKRSQAEPLARPPSEPQAEARRTEARKSVTEAAQALTPLDFVTQIPLGTRVGKHYVVESVLGIGGMGMVFRARDELLMRKVALKFVQPHFIADTETYQRFLSEARAMARIKHPNVVDVYAFGEHEGIPYFVMEYVDGRTAEDWFLERLRTHGEALPIDEVVGILDQCCAGVAAIHAAGAVHGDLKPANVLLDHHYRAMLADFGLAMLLDHGETNAWGGTPDYMAPEVLLELTDEDLIQRRDVFSLGVMAYEFLVGRRPFPSRTMAEVVDHPLTPPAPPSQWRTDLPEAFDAAVLGALQLDPALRTPTVDRLRQDLAAARHQLGRPKRRARIVAIDDDPAFCDWLQHTFLARLPDVELVCFQSGESGLRELCGNPPDMALIDMQLPDFNGIELTVEIRAHSELARMPLHVITAHGTAADWKLLSELGADGFMMKPVSAGAIVSIVERSLEQAARARVA